MIVGLLSWWDETPATLVRCVVPLARFCDHLVAVDGAYAAMPGAERQPTSPGDQADAIAAAAESAGLGLTLHRPAAPWPGEVEKRSSLFKIAGLVCEPGDWLFALDADEAVREVPADLRLQLDASARSVATVTYTSDGGDSHDRRFVRWSPSLRVESNHYSWTDGPFLLRGDLDGMTLEQPEHLHGFRLEHLQSEAKRERQRVYYERRDRLDLETTARIPDGASAVYAFEPREGSRHFAMVVSPTAYAEIMARGYAELDGRRAAIVVDDCDQASGFMRFCLDDPYRKPVAA